MLLDLRTLIPQSSICMIREMGPWYTISVLGQDERSQWVNTFKATPGAHIAS